MLLVSNLRILCLAIDCEDGLFFFLKVLCFTFKSVTQFELIFCKGMRLELRWFHLSMSVGLTLFVEKSVLLPWIAPARLLIMLVWVLFWILYADHTLIYVSVLSPVPHCFGYCCHIVNLEIECTESSYTFYFSGCTTWLVGSQFPNLALNPGPSRKSPNSWGSPTPIILLKKGFSYTITSVFPYKF